MHGRWVVTGSSDVQHLSGTWWEMLQISSSELDYVLTVTVDTSLATNAVFTSTVFNLTEIQPTGIAAHQTVSAELLGALSSYFAFPVLTSSKAIIRKDAGNLSPIGSNDILVVDDSMVTLHGNECNKIGVFFEAFRYYTLSPYPF